MNIDQAVINIALFALSVVLTGLMAAISFILQVIWRGLLAAQEADLEQSKEMKRVELLMAKSYITQDGMDRALKPVIEAQGKMDRKLDKIDAKLERRSTPREENGE